jgi:hypothetical protein
MDPMVNINIPPPEAPAPELTQQIPPVQLLPKKRKPEGLSALGISVLLVRGRVAHLSESLMDLLLDSCADVTLISETFYESLKFKPKLCQGMCMKL